MKLVILESPYAGDVELNVEYARKCLRDSLSRGEAPIASHLLYTQPGVLDDDSPSERKWGIDAGLAWGRLAEATVVYTDRGISRGMEYGIAAAKRDGRPVEYRRLSKKVCRHPDIEITSADGSGVEGVCRCCGHELSGTAPMAGAA